MPTVESVTRMEYSKILACSARKPRDRISVTTEPISARIFRKRA
jgi:hypothetical protein